MSAAPVFSGLDPLSHAYRVDPLAAVQRPLAECPVSYYEPLNCYVVLGYARARAILSDHETFSSRVFRVLPDPDADPEAQRVAKLMIEGQALNMDPPEHTRTRRPAQRAFTHGQVRSVLPQLTAIAHDLIDAFVERGECDLMTEYCRKLALRGVGAMIGLSQADLPSFESFITDLWTLQIPVSAPRNPNMTPEALHATYARALTAYQVFSAFVADRRAHPRDDLASSMLALAGEDGQPLMTDDQVLTHLVGFTVAGTGTTANLMGYAVRLLTQNPAALDEARADPSLWEAVVEESVRCSSPSTFVWRRTTSDTEIDGIAIPADRLVAVNLAAANADPGKFPEPQTFDIHRERLSDHIGFGLGRHFCMGSPLARPEARVGLQTLYGRIPGLVTDQEEEMEFAANFVVRSQRHQRVTWDPERAVARP